MLNGWETIGAVMLTFAIFFAVGVQGYRSGWRKGSRSD